MTLSPVTSRAADHIDTKALNDPAGNAVDIADLYVWNSKADTDSAVLVMTVAPLTPAGDDAKFDDNALYEFHLDTDGDLSNGSEHKYQVRTRTGDVRVKGNGVDLQGKQGDMLSSGKVKFWAGTADDPFFIDLTGLLAVLGGTGSFTGADTVKTTNVAGIVLEIPKSMLKNGGQDKLRVWATTTR